MNRGKRSPQAIVACVRSCGGNFSTSLSCRRRIIRNAKKGRHEPEYGGFGAFQKKKGFCVCKSSIAWPPNALTISHCVKQIPQGGLFKLISLQGQLPLLLRCTCKRDTVFFLLSATDLWIRQYIFHFAMLESTRV